MADTTIIFDRFNSTFDLAYEIIKKLPNPLNEEGVLKSGLVLKVETWSNYKTTYFREIESLSLVMNKGVELAFIMYKMWLQRDKSVISDFIKKHTLTIDQLTNLCQ